MTSIPSIRFDNVRLLVADFPACFRFYSGALGFECTWGDEQAAFASLALAGHGTLGLFRRELMAAAVGTSNLPSAAPAQDRFALVLEVEDVDAAAVALRAKGWPVLAPARDMPDWGLRTLHLRDPDGNLLELFHPLDRARWSERLQEEDGRQGREAP